MVHDFNIDELNVHSPMTKNGESNTVEFTADKVGVFEFYCSVGQHRKNGQVGKITVE
jgi:plastocyanin